MLLKNLWKNLDENYVAISEFPVDWENVCDLHH